MRLDPFAPLVFALVATLPAAALAFSSNAPGPERNPVRVTSPAQPGVTSSTAGPSVESAKAACGKLLADLALDYEMLPPIRQGACGAPAPIRLKSVGSDPKVVISPPAIVRCAVAASLAAWLKDTVQPEAMATFGMPVVKLRNAASYSCRYRNNASNGILSEHALANALDISAFVLQSGEYLTVLRSWPRVAVAPSPPPPEPNPTRVPEATGSVSEESPVASSDVAELIKVNPFVLPTPSPAPVLFTPAVLPVAPPKAGSPRRARPEQKSAFVRSVYKAACKNFGTTLGPSSDAHHRNHFHFDMKHRRSGYCR
jgi:hypothetical protein